MLGVVAQQSLPAPSGGGYTAFAADIAGGATSALGRSAPLRNSSDTGDEASSAVGTFSMWVKADPSSDGSRGAILGALAGGTMLRFSKEASGQLIINITVAGGTVVYFGSSGTFTSSSGWVHLAFSYDCGANQADIYLNGAFDSSPGGTPGSTVDWGVVQDFALCRTNYTSSGGDFACNIADFYYNTQERLDLSITANLEKLIDSGGKPVDLGADGSNVTGAQPALCFNSSAAWTTGANAGYGGAFTVLGSAPTAAATSPSD